MMLRTIVLSIILITALSHSTAQQMRVLFVGNSYTHYNNMPKMFHDIAESKNIKMDVHMSAKSSHTFHMHSERMDLYQDIKSQKWDYVVLQGFSRELATSYATIDTAVVPYVQRIVDSIYSNNPCTNILLYETWGYEKGFPEDSVNMNYQIMSDHIHQGYLYLSQKFDFPIVPVGKVWETVKENNPSINLYNEDLQHPSKYGSYLAACSFYAAIFKMSPLSAYSDGLNIEQAKYIQNTSFTVVDLNLNRYLLSRNVISVKSTSKDAKYQAECSANYPKAKSIVWNFGDGKTANTFQTKHVYTKPGTYIITITIQDSCGERIIKKKVVF